MTGNPIMAEVVLPCDDVNATVAFFVERLGFAIERISPADDPAVAVLHCNGLRVRLDRSSNAGPGTLRVTCDDPAAVAGDPPVLTAPNGTTILLVPPDRPGIELPPVQQSFVLTRLGDGAPWVTGRAGMEYRDLVPGRQGGRFIASHIRIPEGGPVPDYVHFHEIRFQLIFCARGWVRVVYEDQGPPFVLEAGDCVLQPPRIRHRVLESSPGLEVIEVGCPARHDTFADPHLTLPTATVLPDRDFGGQRFVRHVARTATWQPSPRPGFEHRDTGIAAATGGLAGVRVLRHSTATPAGPSPTPASPPPAAPAGPPPALWAHGGELLLMVVLAGTSTLCCEGREPLSLEAGDAVAIPAGTRHAVVEPSDDLELLEITLPASSDGG